MFETHFIPQNTYTLNEEKSGVTYGHNFFLILHRNRNTKNKRNKMLESKFWYFLNNYCCISLENELSPFVYNAEYACAHKVKI